MPVTPADLKGLNIGVQPSGSTYVFLKAFLAANGMEMSDIQQSTVTPPYENYLLLGRVDAGPLAGLVAATLSLLVARRALPSGAAIPAMAPARPPRESSSHSASSR